MASEWKNTRIGDVVSINSDSYSKSENWGVIKYLDTGNITENQIDTIQTFVVNKDKIPSRAKRKVKKGDIVYSLVRPIQKHFGVLKVDTENLLVSTGFATIRAKPGEADTDFIFWFLTQPTVISYLQAVGENSTSAYPAIKPSDLESLEINLPPLGKQKDISLILNRFNDKIELNKKINQTLEQMAQALFKSWFVDFDPVFDNLLDKHGNNLEKAKGYLKSKGAEDLCPKLTKRFEQRQQIKDQKPLPQDIRNLFPSDFHHDQDLGWIPEGWEMKELSEIATELRRGVSPKYTEEGGVAVVNQKCIRGHTINFSLCRRNDPKKRKIVGRELKVGDVLINSTGVGTLGRIAQVKFLPEPAVVDSHVTIVRADESFYPKNVFGQLMLSMEQYIESLGEGSTGQTELSRKILSQQKILLPDYGPLCKLDMLLKAIYSKETVLAEDTINLGKLRDTLLPKLINGAVKIGN